jgi:PAS domain S-box-containing protein
MADGGWPGDGALWAAVVASAPLAILTCDAERRIRSANAAAVGLVGRPVDEVVGAPLGSLFPGWCRDDALARIEAAVAVGGDHLEQIVRRGDGAELPAGISWAPLRLDDEVAGIVGIGRDISHRKRLEHELEAMAHGVRELGEVSDLGMYRFSFDADGRMRVDHLNPVLEARLGLSSEQLAVDPSPLWRRLSATAVQRLAAQRAGAEPAAQPIEASWQHPDGTTIPIELREVPIRDAEGRLTSALGLVTDVTEHRRRQQALAETLRLEQQAADELRRVDELRRLFLQAVSHELRTPLTTVLGFSSTLRDRHRVLGRGDVLRMAERINRQGRRIERLLDDLLDIERLSRGVVVAERQPLDLADLVTAVAAEEGDRLVEVDAPPTPATVDPAKVERIVVNLLGNARRHAGADAAVQLALRRHGERIRLTVDDDGPGLPDDLKVRVFEPFEQGPTATTAASPGTGIGLALVASFAALHGGRAWAEDSHLGGARFVVELADTDVDPPTTVWPDPHDPHDPHDPRPHDPGDPP